MVVFPLGAAGAALATVFAKAVPAVIAVILLHNRKNDAHIDLRNLKFEKSKLHDIVVIGLPSAIGGSVTQFAFLLLTKNVLEYGEQAMAAYGVGNKINGLISLPCNGIGSAVATIVSQNMGAGQVKRAQKAYKMAMFGIVLFLIVSGFILSRDAISMAIVSIFAKDSRYPYHWGLTSELRQTAIDAGVDYVMDIFTPHYGTDCDPSLAAGYDIRHSAIGPGTANSHGYERTHIEGLRACFELLWAYLSKS